MSGHKFYVCDFKTKHKKCILAYHNFMFLCHVFLGMLHLGISTKNDKKMTSHHIVRPD